MTVLKFEGPDSPRLDRFITDSLPQLPMALLHRLLRQNKLKLNGKKQPLSTRLAVGDEVRLYLPPQADGFPPVEILYEDDALLAANNPAGLVCLAQAGQDSLLQRVHAQQGLPGGSPWPALCHRLDTGTCGLVLLAKTPEALDFVTGLLREHRLEKTYWGVSVGQPAPPAGLMRNWLLKDARKGLVRVLGQPMPGAKTAETAYSTLATGGQLALLQLQPRTGRTHQLRAQLAAAGTPLLGDSKYGIQAVNRKLRCRYQCLCAGQLTFPAISTGPWQAYSGLQLACKEPWFYTQLLNGGLFWEGEGP